MQQDLVLRRLTFETFLWSQFMHLQRIGWQRIFLNIWEQPIQELLFGQSGSNTRPFGASKLPLTDTSTSIASRSHASPTTSPAFHSQGYLSRLPPCHDNCLRPSTAQDAPSSPTPMPAFPRLHSNAAEIRSFHQGIYALMKTSYFIRAFMP